MSLPNGIYQIRFVPKHVHLPFAGGVYATGESINTPVRAEALNPSAPGEQMWRVHPVEGKRDTYNITYPGIAQSGGDHGVGGHGPVIPGFGLGKKRGPNEPVRLTVDIMDWVITQVDPKNGIYRIEEPANGMVGALHAITEENGRLLVMSYPINPGMQNIHPLPQWQFIPVKN